MAEIKTREKRQGIKVLDKTVEIGVRARETARRMKDTGARFTEDLQESPNDYATEQVQERGQQLAGDAAGLLVRQGKKLARSARGKLNRSDGDSASAEPDDSGEGVPSPELEVEPKAPAEPSAEPSTELGQNGAPFQPEADFYDEPMPDIPDSFSQQVSPEYPAPRRELPDNDFSIKARETVQAQLPPEQHSIAPEPEEISPRIKARDSVGAPASPDVQSIPGQKNPSGQPVSLPCSAPKERPRTTVEEDRLPAGPVNGVKASDHSSLASQPLKRADEKGRLSAARTVQKKATARKEESSTADIPVRAESVPDSPIPHEPVSEREAPWIRTRELVEAEKQKSPKEIRTKESAGVHPQQLPVYTDQGRQLAIQSAAQRKAASRQKETAEAPSFPGASAESSSSILHKQNVERPATFDHSFTEETLAVRINPTPPELDADHKTGPMLSAEFTVPKTESYVSEQRQSPRIKTAERQSVRTKEMPWIRTSDRSTGSAVPYESAKQPAPHTPCGSVRIRESQSAADAWPIQGEQTPSALRRTQFPRSDRSAPRTVERPEQKPIKTAERTQRSIRQSARSAGKARIKTAQKSAKTSRQAVKTAEQTRQAAAKTAQKTAQASAKAAQKTSAAARATTHAAVITVKAASEAAATAAKTIAEAAKGLVALIAEGGGVAALVIIVICLIGLIVGSSFGIFFSGESDASGGETISDAVREINEDYEETIDAILDDVDYDDLVKTGTHAVWREVLAIYAVMVSTDSENPQNAAAMTDEKKALLSSVFWAMTTVAHRTETYTETETVEVEGEDGEMTEEEVEVEKTRLYVTVQHKTASEIAEVYGFTADQLAQLNELLANENSLLWSALLYGIASSDDAIVTVALSQIGNVGGQPYWSWYGYSRRVEWCAIFVSWCANECGYLDSGIIPRFEGCIWGVNWFKSRGQWIDGDAEPAPGMLIFFDWNDPNGSAGPQDGLADHVGIVEKVEDGYVYTIEGNSGDQCKNRRYPVGFSQILGYGMPEYE